MIFYFTATGNSLYAAKRLCVNPNEIPISIPQMLKRKTLNFSDSGIGIVSPVFTGELPLIVREFIQKSSFDTPYLYFVLTYGNDYSIAAEWSKNFASQYGLNVDYIGTVKMVDNFLPAFDMDAQKRIDKKVDEQLDLICADIQKKARKIPKSGLKARMLYKMVKGFQKKNPSSINGSLITVTENCIGCGICEKVCPQHIFRVKDATAKRIQEICQFCLSCVHNCPEKAINLGTLERNPQARYRNEHITLKEIMESNEI